MKYIIHIRTFLFSIVITLFSFNTINAQEIGGGQSNAEKIKNSEKIELELMTKPSEDRAEIYTNEMAQTLQLSDKQKQQVYLINLEAAQKMDAIRLKYKNNPDKIIKEGKVVDKEHDIKLSNILNASQWNTYIHNK